MHAFTGMPFSDALLPWLPLVYVAWSDGDLDDAELEALRDRAARHDEVPGAVVAWLDPSRRPTACELASMLETIRSVATKLPESDRRSLADLGAAMGALDGRRGPSGTERDALRELEDALGVLGSAATSSLVAGARPRPEGGEREAPFDRSAMQAVLDGRHAELRDSLRRWLADESHRPPYRLAMARHRSDARAWLAELAELGVGKLAFPGVTTGDDDLAAFMSAFETLSFGDLSLVVKAGVQWGLFGGSIYFLGSDAQRERYLGEVASLALPGCFAMTETAHGSNVAELETTARYIADAREIEIHTPSDGARKDYIGGAAEDARMATVFAKLEVDGHDHGVHAFLVPIRDEGGETLPGVRVIDDGEKLGLHGVDNGRLWFDRVRVPRDALLSRFATLDDDGYRSDIPSPGRRFFTMLGTLVGGRISVAAGAVSAAKVGLAIAVRYAHHRRQFGPPGEPEVRLIDYPAHQQKLMPYLASTYALGFAVAELRERFAARSEGDDDESRKVEALVAGVKALSTWNAADALQTSRECCGGQGYLAINRVGVLRADTDVFTTFEGDNTVLLQLVAKSLLTERKSHFEEAPVSSVVSLITRRARSLITDKNFIARRRVESGHLRGRATQQRLLESRCDDLLATASARISKRLDAGAPPSAALIELQSHLLALARAHVEHFVFEATSRAIAACDDRDLRRALVTLSDLYALSRIEADAAWFLEQGYLEPRKYRAIAGEVETLCSEVAAMSRPLVDAFGIPDTALSAPIAFADPAGQEGPA